MTYTTAVVADHLKNNVDFHRFSKLVKAMGPQLNTEQLRFLKARVFEKSIEKYSNKSLSYVAQDGCDFLITGLNNTRLEMKYTEGAIYTSKKRELREYCNIKLTNSHGTNTHAVLPPDYADFLMFVSDCGAVLFDKPTLLAHSTSGGDGITAKVPTSLGIIIADYNVMNGGNQTEIDFIQQLDKSVEVYASRIV